VVDVLVILDGASERPGATTLSLELAAMPALRRLKAEGQTDLIDNVPAGLPVGSETAISTLLGWKPEAAVDRGAIEAAARMIKLSPGEHAWRVDVIDHEGGRDAAAASTAAIELRALAPEHAVYEIGGHRLLAVGRDPLPTSLTSAGLRVWPSGAIPPRILDDSTVVIGAPGAAIGLARLLGARTVTPAGATGRPGSDLAAKREGALNAIADGARRVVVHVGGADEAAHEHDRAAKIKVLEEADRELIGPLAERLREIGGTLQVCSDHGCDPDTGEHVAGPVPSVTWRALVLA
jgi:2,3-bisphosphoglycerate-independent phosphoglycerate mutase